MKRFALNHLNKLPEMSMGNQELRGKTAKKQITIALFSSNQDFGPAPFKCVTDFPIFSLFIKNETSRKSGGPKLTLVNPIDLCMDEHA